MRLLWPIHISKVPLSQPGVKSLESVEFGKELAELALQGFDTYVNKTLPRELDLDKRFADEFHNSDHSRVNLAFRRWQKRVFGDMNEDIFSDGQPGEDILDIGPQADFLAGTVAQSPRLNEIEYTWPELYKNATFKKLRSRINELAKLYLKRSNMPPENIPKKFRVFIWAEVFRKGDSLSPRAHTDGGLLMGRYWPQMKKNALKFNFEDPRGINPPFGKTHSHATEEAVLSMFPTWASHFITPNMKKGTVVCLCFIVYDPADGGLLDFEDDSTGSFVVTETFKPR